MRRFPTGPTGSGVSTASSATAALPGGRGLTGRKAFLVVTDVGLVTYWALTAAGVVSVGDDEWLTAWNWSFLPLDALAIAAGLTWSLLPRTHRWSAPVYAAALALTHAAGLLALSFFALWGTWDASWWLVNLWLMFMPVGLALASLRDRAPGTAACRPT